MATLDIGPEQAVPMEERFAQIYRSETPWLIRYFRQRLRGSDEAHDLAQETMLRFMRVAPSTAIDTPQAYLRTIASNLLKDRAERGSTRLTAVSVPLIEGHDGAADFDQHRELAGREELSHWEAVLRRLKPKTLEIFLLSRVDGYTYQEIAQRHGMTVSGVKKHMTMAIAHVDRHRKGRR